MSDKRATTRRGILTAAIEMFVRQGYAGTSLREIGRVADVDPALVIHYFGSKETLFLEAMSAALPAGAALEGPLDGLGERFIRFVLESDSQVRPIFLALIRASDADGVGMHLRESHELTFVAPLRARLSGPDAELRARLAAALVGGLFYALWVVGDEALLAADPEAVVRHYGRLMQNLLDPVA